MQRPIQQFMTAVKKPGGWAKGAEEIALQWICYGNTGSLKSSDGVQQLKIKK